MVDSDGMSGVTRLLDAAAAGDLLPLVYEGLRKLAQQTEPVRRLVAVQMIKPGTDSKQVPRGSRTGGP